MIRANRFARIALRIARATKIRIKYRQASLLGVINVQLQIQNRVARRINFDYGDLWKCPQTASHYGYRFSLDVNEFPYRCRADFMLETNWFCTNFGYNGILIVGKFVEWDSSSSMWHVWLLSPWHRAFSIQLEDSSCQFHALTWGRGGGEDRQAAQSIIQLQLTCFHASVCSFLPFEKCFVLQSKGHSTELGEGQFQDGPLLHKVREGNSFPKAAGKGSVNPRSERRLSATELIVRTMPASSRVPLRFLFLPCQVTSYKIALRDSLGWHVG